MPIDEREYMRDVPEYRRLIGAEPAPAAAGGGGGRRPPPTTFADPPHEPSWWPSPGTWRTARRRRTRPLAWFLLGVVVTLSTVGYVAERGVPFLGGSTVGMAPLIVPALAPGAHAPLRLPLDGPEKIAVGTTVTVKGKLPPQQGRIVLVRARWNGGIWEGLRATEAAEDGSFRVRYTLERPGTAQIRIVFADGSFAYKWYRVS